MQYGVTFPQTESGADPSAIRDFGEAVEAMGFDYLLAYDHVLGADPSARPGEANRRFPYTYKSTFHEPLVLFGYLAAATTRLRFATGVIILGQRQTALVAKQAAAVDVLSGGRLRFGVGSGWNEAEYEALGMDFHTRGARYSEQIEVLRALWTQEVVTFRGKWHTLVGVGINPLPVQRPIPVWMGGSAEAAIRRIAQIGNGWIVNGGLSDETQVKIGRMRDYAKLAGRDASSIGIEGSVHVRNVTPADMPKVVEQWRSVGATHVVFNTMGAGFTSLEQHAEALRKIKACFS